MSYLHEASSRKECPHEWILIKGSNQGGGFVKK